jgi:hypothetical protein
MSLLQDVKRRILGRPKAEGMNLPTEQEINPEGDCCDGQTAVDHFLGKSQEQITNAWAKHGHYYYEDLYYMGPRAFCFYFPAVVDYVTTAGTRDDNDVAGDLCPVVESRLKYHFAEIREALPAIVRFADFVLTHYDDFGYDPDFNEDLRPRLTAIRHQCAERRSR